MTNEARERLHLAQAERRTRVEFSLDQRIDAVLDRIGLSEDNCLKLSQADTVGPNARHKLKGILRHYAKDKHPFRACVKDNTKRFGVRAKPVCAVLKDIIRGTTKWRGKANPMDRGVAPGILSQDTFAICDLDDDIAVLLEGVDHQALTEMLAEIDAEGDSQPPDYGSGTGAEPPAKEEVTSGVA